MNILTAVTETGSQYAFTYDAYGNNTSVSIVNGGSRITTTAAYTADGNRMVSATDALGKTTTYSYNADTNILEWVQYPEDTAATRTNYTYDSMYRMASAAVTTDTGLALSAAYTYTDDYLTKIQTASTAYAQKNGMLLSQSYGNGSAVSYTYDILGRAKTTTYSSGRVLSYVYTGDGQLYSIHDSATGYTYIYTYDSLGRLSASRVENAAGNVLMRTRLEYNASSQITKQVWKIGNTTYQETYTYNTGDASLKSYQNALGQTVSLSYDSLRRLSTVTAGNIYTQTYTYRDIGTNKTTPQVANLAYSGFTGAPSYGYTYDALGNIAAYTQGGKTYTYSYDALNQLTGVVEKDSAGNVTGSWAYTYDLGGNILTANDGTSSHTYTYGDAQWADLLTAFDGHAITYDASGNPLTYYNGQSYAFTWSEGRRLATATVNGSTISYAYDMDGLRVSKTVNGVTHTYTYASGKLLRETYGSNTLDFFYDQNGRPYALKYNGATYYYITNLQGDVLSLISASGSTVASYTYDPYGKPLTATGTLANINPLRYRGYYYDSETSLYYLQSRYYDPTTCRFINADTFASTGQGVIGHNMFAYCGNNSVNNIDPNGRAFVDLIAVILDTLLDNLDNLVAVLSKTIETITVFSNLIAMGFDNVTIKSAHECAETMAKHGIDTVNEKAHFFAQCYVEGGTSTLEAGYLPEDRAEAYRKTRPYYPYYGAGYIQLTWECNYKEFAEYMNDPLIYELGPEYVAENYAWAAAGWFWSNNNINEVIARGGTVRDVTKIVNGGYNALERRENAYYSFLKLLGG